MCNLYIVSNKIHCDVIIHADTMKDCEDTFSQLLGYKNFAEMESILGEDVAKLDEELIYQER